MKSVGSKRRARGVRTALVARAAVLVVVALSLCFAIVQRRVFAQIDETMLDLGSRAMAFSADSAGATRTIEINGVSLSFRIESVLAPIGEVVRHYRRVCVAGAEGRGAYGSLIASLATRSRSNSREGYVACVATGAGDFGTLAQKLLTFSETWDVTDAGLPRYVYVGRRSPDPESPTFVFAMWADDSLNLRDLLPSTGKDANGTDPADVPRFPGSRRILSASETGAPSRVYVYAAPRGRSADVGAFYRTQLPARGWDLVERMPGEVIEIDGARLLTAERSGRIVTVLAHQRERGQMLVALLATEPG